MPELGRKSIEEFKGSEKIPITVVLDNVRSMHNVGSIFRTSDAFLIEKICLCGYTPKPPHRDIQKTALGATETVLWEYFSDTILCINQLKNNHLQIISVEQVENSISIDNLTIGNINTPLAVVFGNEVEGVQHEVLKLCDLALEIPQFGSKHSLNVSVAAGIVLYRLCELINVR